MTTHQNTSAHDTVWYSRCPVPTPFAIALKKGWLHQAVSDASHCDQLTWRSLAESRDEKIRAAHFTHAHADVFRHGGNIPPLWARSLGADTRLIGVSWVTMRQQVQVLSDSGIYTPADLAGKRILIQRNANTSVDYWRASTLRTYEAALASAGLTLADVTLVEHVSHVGAKPASNTALPSDGSLWTADRSLLRRRELLLPLVRGEVDAIATQAHYGVEFEGLIGARTIFDKSQSVHHLDRVNNDTPDVLTVSASLIEQKPDVVHQVLLQLLKARDWAKTHRAEVIQLMAQEFKTSEVLVEQSWGDDLVDGLDLNLSEDNIAALQSQQEFLLHHGFITHAVDLEQWIDREPLARALAAHADASKAER
jgi:ABC-type nitrate/sulfonate/bicarbonate transport system substrate-binding protein